MDQILIQGIGFLALFFVIFSFQKQKRVPLLLIMFVGLLLFVIPFYLLNAYIGAMSLYESGSSGTTYNPSTSTSSNRTEMSVPTNATASQYGGWYCNNGYKKNYTANQCDRITVPVNASLNYFGNDWVCNSGYKKNYQTDICDRVMIPANASLNYFGDFVGWVCNSGYKKNRSANQCDPVIVPTNASLNYFGDDWVCNSGYNKNYTANQCNKVIVPMNASLNYYGDRWYCNGGYIQSGQSCIAK